MGNRRLRLTLAFLVVVLAAMLVSGGSAGNRTANVTFEFLPGDSFTYGETFATETTITNTGSSMFTQLEMHHLIPATAGPNPESATLVDSSCGAVIEGNEAVCRFDQLSARTTITVTLLWQTPPSGAGCTACLKTNGFWLIKEGKPTNLNEFFPFAKDPFSATLLGDDPSSERKKAGGYETQGVGTTCAVGAGNLHTNPALTKDDPVSSTVCLPVFAIPSGSAALGLSTTITETSAKPSNGSHKELGQSIVCIAAFGESCVAGHTPVNWGQEKARHIFQILEDALKGPKEVTEVSHNGVKLPLCSVTPNFAQGCLVEIIPPPAGSTPEIWTVVADAPTNGPWNW